MRHLLLALVVLSVVAGPATADVAHTTIGDVPRTFTHFMNAQEAALCRANAAAGGVSAYFFNPAVIANLQGISGQASMRFNITSRDYLPDGDEYLDVSEDGLLLSQGVAAKRDQGFAYGFGYSCPSYRSLELNGLWDGGVYDGDFSGSLRMFEVLGATRIGTDGQGALGIAVGIASVDESAREAVQRALSTADVSGIGASVAIGFVFDATERLTFGAAYRFGTEFDVDGDWKTESGSGTASGTLKTEPVAVGGVRFAATDAITLYASYLNEGWNSAEASAAAYYEDEDCPECNESDGARDEFSDAWGTAAFGAEGTLMEGRLTLRGGFSMPLGSDHDNTDEPLYRELVPEYAAGVGGTVRFDQYSVEAAFVREQYADGDETGQATTNGLYFTVGYEF